MAAPDFYFAVNALFRHIHDRWGKPALIAYWRSLASEYYRERVKNWRERGLQEVARDWQAYFDGEPGAVVKIRSTEEFVTLDVQVCPAIEHLREHGREISPYFCEHCDHTCGAMAEAAGLSFTRIGGMGSCRQQFAILRSAGGLH